MEAAAGERRVELAVLPVEVTELEADAYVVVDVLRATTTIATLFAAGLDDLVVTSEIGLARRLAKEEGRLLFGEVGGLPPEGFDYGNSPVEAQRAPVAGRGAVLFTSNGTAALCGVAGRGPTYAGALANAGALTGVLAGFQRVAIVCAGTAYGTRFALDDFAAAGRIVQRLVRRDPGRVAGDAAALAMEIGAYENWLAPGLPQRTAPTARFISGSQHARALIGLELGGDVQFAAQEDTSAAVPMVVACGEGWARLRDAAGG